MLKQGGKVKSIIHEATAEGHSNMLKFGENEPDKMEDLHRRTNEGRDL